MPSMISAFTCDQGAHLRPRAPPQILVCSTHEPVLDTQPLLARSIVVYCSFVAASLLEFTAGSETLFSSGRMRPAPAYRSLVRSPEPTSFLVSSSGLFVVIGAASFVQSRVGRGQPVGRKAWIGGLFVVAGCLIGFNLVLMVLAFTLA